MKTEHWPVLLIGFLLGHGAEQVPHEFVCAALAEFLIGFGAVIHL